MIDYSSFSNEFGNRLQKQMKKKGFTQEELAAKLSEKYMEINKCEEKYTNRATISSYLHGNTIPRGYELVLLAELLECDVNYLLGINDAPSQKVEMIKEYTYLDEENIELLSSNKDLANFTNDILKSHLLEEVLEKLNKIYRLECCKNIANHFLTNKSLKKLEKFYLEFLGTVISDEYNKYEFMLYLEKHLTFPSDLSAEEVIKSYILPGTIQTFYERYPNLKKDIDNPEYSEEIKKDRLYNILAIISFTYFSSSMSESVLIKTLYDLINTSTKKYLDENCIKFVNNLKKEKPNKFDPTAHWIKPIRNLEKFNN